MSEWFDSENNIIVDTLPELMSAANTRQFGETKAETLTRFLMCEAFERRYVPEEALAFRLAAMIISRIETQPAAQDAPVDAAVPAQQFWAVIAHCGEGVMFEDKRDAEWTHTGQGTGSDGFGVPAIGEAFRDSYEDQPLKLVQVRVINAALAAQKDTND